MRSRGLVKHANFVLLWPLSRDAHVSPAWWTHAWAHVALPVYREPYPIAPHTSAWALASVLGAWLFVRCISDGSDPSRTRARG